MAKRAVYVVIALAGIAAASGAAWCYQKPKAADSVAGSGPAAVPAPVVAASGPAGGRPPTVEAVKVELARLTDDSHAVGSLRSRRGVVLRPEVSGRITQLNFTDGQRVRMGQVLVQFDDQLPRAQVQQSMAELSIAQANQKRNQELVAQNFVSQRSLDESAANLQVAQAKLALARATAARLKIVAPFDGTAGIRLVNVGDYLKDGADIVNIEDIEAIFVDFRLPERLQGKVKRGQQAMLDIDALPGRKYTAVIQAIDPLIDANGRSVGVRACVDNRQLQLRPGMFARVNTVFSVRENARVIPEEAIVPQGSRQFVIKLIEGANDLGPTTQRVEVKVGLRSPGKVEILEGLAPGDRVVTAGQQRVQRDGTVVKVVEVASASPARAASAAVGAAPSAQASSAATTTAALPVASAPPVTASAAVASGPASTPPALSGPNPCGPAVAQAVVPTKPTRSPQTPAARAPA
ncbi:MAG: efflux RND transporter periplasmic adaptor subunit [Polaromonas sp.]|uniref:efflux RND transporter periplasmic adaptor subunit n=1 Tax=Polaromonas sp. TaxID=1869339 RepID=UPI0017FDF2E4|nr:efflux RND transporter periplasmic adaptor subunit [Polaromonas sp.]MBA3595198.1 efflux RND transporter periplasmic adaptor subunit [Polaromonas sp.]